MNLPIDKQAAQLIRLFQQAEQYIENLVAEEVQRNPRQRSLLFWRRRAQMVALELEKIRKQLLKQVPDLVGNSYRIGQEIAITATGVELREAAAFGSGVDARAMAILAAEMNRRLNFAIATVGRRADDAFRHAGLRAVTFHVMAGTDTRRAAQTMEAMLKRDGTRAFVDRAGREWSLQHYTSMVIRTTTREAVSQGTFNGLTQSGHELIEFSHHANSCKKCLPYDGKVFSLPTASPDMKRRYPVVDKLAPIHPQCRHVVGPAGVEFDILERELLGTVVPA